MVLLNSGSIADKVFKRLDNIPSYYSGAEMISAINERLSYMSDELGTTIDSTAIAANVQGIIMNFALADTSRIIESEGTDGTDFKIGEFSTSKGQGSSSLENANNWERTAKEMLLSRKGKYNFAQSWS